MQRLHLYAYFLFLVFIITNFLFWRHAHHIRIEWENVPSAPTVEQTSMMGLGDKQLSYRVNSMKLQNFGETGGRNTSLKDYDFKILKDWFFLQDKLDPISDMTPMLAAYYYGAVQDTDKLDDVLDYLAVIGQRPHGNKWRWLGHAVYLARHVQENNDRALELAYLLADNKNPNMADWARQMPVFVLEGQGETELAYQLMLSLLVSNVDTMHPAEIFYMKDYICNILLNEQTEIPKPEFCEEIPAVD